MQLSVRVPQLFRAFVDGDTIGICHLIGLFLPSKAICWKLMTLDLDPQKTLRPRDSCRVRGYGKSRCVFIDMSETRSGSGAIFRCDSRLQLPGGHRQDTQQRRVVSCGTMLSQPFLTAARTADRSQSCSPSEPQNHRCFRLYRHLQAVECEAVGDSRKMHPCVKSTLQESYKTSSC